MLYSMIWVCIYVYGSNLTSNKSAINAYKHAWFQSTNAVLDREPIEGIKQEVSVMRIQSCLSEVIIELNHLSYQ